MKKKVKLITTFASLGLALALMVFGVYAATTDSFTVSTNVTFTATRHVKATVLIQETPKYNGEEPVYANAAATGLTNGAMSININDSAAQTGDLTNIQLGEVVLDETDYKYSYTVKITNDDAESPLYVDFTVPAAPIATDGYTVEWTNQTDANIAKSSNLTVTCVITVTRRNGTAVTVDNEDLQLTVALYSANDAGYKTV